MLIAKRRMGKRVIYNFFTGHVLPKSTMALALEFTQNGISLSGALETSFEILSARLRQDKVIDACGDMLLRVIQLANWRRNDQPLISGSVNVKVFLAAYMIATHPSHVFEMVGDLASKVLSASRPMLECFHDTATALGAGVSWPLVRKDVAKQLPALLHTYLRTFKVVFPGSGFQSFERKRIQECLCSKMGLGFRV
jgi:hypothetical protein